MCNCVRLEIHSLMSLGVDKRSLTLSLAASWRCIVILGRLSAMGAGITSCSCLSKHDPGTVAGTITRYRENTPRMENSHLFFNFAVDQFSLPSKRLNLRISDNLVLHAYLKIKWIRQISRVRLGWGNGKKKKHETRENCMKNYRISLPMCRARCF